MLSYQGCALGKWRPVVGEVCREECSADRKNKVLISEKSPLFAPGYCGIVTCQPSFLIRKPTIQLERIPADLHNGDCVLLTPDGNISVVWQADSQHNTLLLTESCNCQCVMCPQPPKPHDKWLEDIAYDILSIINPKTTKTICITGGEPTILGERFLKLVYTIRENFPETDLILLTNGKNFENYDFANSYFKVAPKSTLTCVSLHSDIEALHDEIVGVKGSFAKTVQGLYSLARLRMRVEIRHVISKLNADRLESFARFVYRNFPFSSHIALMGIEMTGCAQENADKLWIDPADYGEILDKAIWSLHRTTMSASIYNIPLCLLPQRSWPFARQSISTWKNNFLNICAGCLVQAKCAGFFSTSGKLFSTYIRPVTWICE